MHFCSKADFRLSGMNHTTNEEGVATMRARWNKLICFIVTILVLLSGTYFENVKTDSLFVYPPVEETTSQILVYGAVLRDAKLCTTEMLGDRNSAGMQQMTSQHIGHRKELRVSLTLLCSDVFSLFEGKFFTGSGGLHFHSQYRQELIARYIEKSDGKKRI